MRWLVAVGLGCLCWGSGATALFAQNASTDGELPWRTLAIPSAGRRGNAAFCLLSPRSEWGSDRRPWVLNLQPALLWRGELGRVELAEEHTGRIVWSQRVGDRPGFLMSGISLIPGRSYTWLTYDANDLLTHAVSFQVVGGEVRQRIVGLLAETKRNAEKAAPDPETQTWERVRTLSQQNLWADVLQEMYSLENPSPGLSRFLQDLEQTFCGDRVLRLSRPLTRTSAKP